MGKNNEYSRHFCFVLYPDNENHLDIVNKLPSYRYLAILHDRGLESDDDAGPDRKIHYHVYLRFENKRSRDKTALDLGLELNLLRVCGNPDGYMLYMLHKGYEDKEQFSFNELIGDERLKKRVKKLLSAFSLDEDDKVEKLLDWIDEQDNIRFQDFVRYSLRVGLWDVVKRSQYLFRSMIIDHNVELAEKERLDSLNPFLQGK